MRDQDRRLRPSMLDSARRASKAQVAQRVQRLTAPSSGVVVGVLLEVEQPPEFPETRVLVDVGGGAVWVLADPAAYVVGGSVYVEVDSQRRPRKVTGPTGVPVPDSTVPTTVEQGALPVVIQPAAMLDQAARDAANDAVTKLGRAFTTSQDEPTVEDGMDRPNNAIWTQVNAAGEQVARWRWDATTGQWVSEPFAVEIIPAAYVDHLLTNDLFTRNLTLSDEVDGYINRTSGRGVEIFGPDGMPLSRYGAFTENALNFYREGEPVASISDAGVVSALEGAFDTLSVGGEDLTETLNSRSTLIYNRRFPLPRDMTGYGGHSYIVFNAEPRRDYKVTCRFRARSLNNTGLRMAFRGTEANEGSTPPTPTHTSPIMPNTVEYTLPDAYGGTSYANYEYSFIYSPIGDVPKVAAILLAVGNIDVPGELQVREAWWTVEDMGPRGHQNGGSYSDAGGGYPDQPAPPPAAPIETPKQRYTKRYTSTEWRTFENVTGNNTGSRTTSVSGPTQGQTPYYPSAGQYASHYYFNHGQIQADLAGATVISARVRLTCTHSHSNSGGTARLHLHGHGPSGNWGSPSFVADSRFARGQTKWLGVTSQGWRTGEVRGIGLWSRNSSSTNYYTRFGTTAVLEIVYEK